MANIEDVVQEEPWPVTSTVTIVNHGDGKPSLVVVYSDTGDLISSFYAKRALISGIVAALTTARREQRT